MLKQHNQNNVDIIMLDWSAVFCAKCSLMQLYRRRVWLLLLKWKWWWKCFIVWHCCWVVMCLT